MPDADPAPTLPKPPAVGGTLPEVDLRQLRRMTDGTGILQHAVYGVPDPNHGYCIDDNARALIAAVHHAKLFGYDEDALPLSKYLAFVAYAYNEEIGAFRNFMSYDRRWLEERGSEDSQGRAIWALGLTVRDAPTADLQNLAGDLFRKGLPGVAKLAPLRSRAFTLLGLNAYLDYESDYAPVLELRDRFAESLYAVYRAYATADWPWWERLVTYDNAKLCQALYESGRAMGRDDMKRDAAAALHWLITQQTACNEAGQTWLSIIGNDGWLAPDRPRAFFDQQPLEAYALTQACLVVAHGEADAAAAVAWRERAAWCFAWFLGRNDLGKPLADPVTGGCRDGLQVTGVNRNQGAESSLAYLLSLLLLSDTEH